MTVEPIFVRMTIIRRRVVGHRRRTPVEVRVRFAPLPPEDVTVVRGLRVTTVTRTLIDLAGDLELHEALRLTRQALDRRLVSLDELRRAAETCTDLETIDDFREVLRLLDASS